MTSGVVDWGSRINLLQVREDLFHCLGNGEWRMTLSGECVGFVGSPTVTAEAKPIAAESHVIIRQVSEDVLSPKD